MRNAARVVAILFGLQTALFGAVLNCGCQPAQGAAVQPPTVPMECCEQKAPAPLPEHDCCCSIKAQQEESSPPASVAPTVAPHPLDLPAESAPTEPTTPDHSTIEAASAPPTSGPCCGDPQAQRAPPAH